MPSPIDDRLESIRHLSKFSRDAADTIKIPSLSKAFATLSNILDAVQRVRRLKDECWSLAEKAARVLVAVRSQLDTDARLTTSERLETHLRLLVETVEAIHTTVQLACMSKWKTWFLKEESLETRVKDCQQRLNDILNLFLVTSVIEFQDLPDVLKTRQMIIDYDKSSTERYAEVKQGQERIVAALNSVHQRLSEASVDAQSNNDVRIVSTGEIVSGDIFMTTSQGHQLYYAELRGPRVHAVILKSYAGRVDAEKAFVRDLSRWREQTSPYLMQLIGRSSKEAKLPYLVFTGVIPQDVRSFMRDQHLRAPMTGFISTLKMIEGLASACEYLGNSGLVTTGELSQSTQLSNLMLNTEGKIIVGRNMLDAVENTAISSQVPSDMWMKDHLVENGMKLIFGRAINFADWQEVAGFTGMPYLRALVKYIAFYTNYSMVDMVNNLQDLYRRLQDQQMELGPLTFQQIRAAMMESPVINHNHVFRPPTHVDVALGDLGYIDTQTGTPVFVKLANFLHELGHHVYHDPLTVISASPDPCWEMCQNPDGSCCYTFKYPQYIHIRRLHSSTFLQDHKHAWQFLIDNASMLEEKFCKGQGLTLHQLILVVGIEEELRRAYLEVCHDLEQPDTIEAIHFHEDGTPTTTAWGHWSLSPDSLENEFSSEHFSIRFTRYPQNIAFAQLEDGDS